MQLRVSGCRVEGQQLWGRQRGGLSWACGRHAAWAHGVAAWPGMVCGPADELLPDQRSCCLAAMQHNWRPLFAL